MTTGFAGNSWFNTENVATEILFIVNNEFVNVKLCSSNSFIAFCENKLLNNKLLEHHVPSDNLRHYPKNIYGTA